MQLSGLKCSSRVAALKGCSCRCSSATSFPLEIEVHAPLSVEWKRNFLKNYWQKRPLLIRKFKDNFKSPEGPDRQWQLWDGPFEEAFFSVLPETKWQLLVNGVDRFVPEIAALLDDFDFLPRWRIDDVMISHAAPGGSIGPHADSYDVFLLQGEGRKRWSISVDKKYDPDDPEQHVEDLDMRILSDFQPEASWVLEPGDMLYIPPHIAHQGVALDSGQTLSIGFLAPKVSDILSAYVLEAAERMDSALRYSDPDMTLQEHPGELSSYAIDKVKDIIESLPRSHDDIASWLGRHVTTPRGMPTPTPPDDTLAVDTLKTQFQAGDNLCRNESTRMAYAQLSGGCTLFVDSLEFRQGIPLASAKLHFIRLLTCESELSHAEVAPMAAEDESIWDILLDLYNDGYLYFKSEQFENEEDLPSDTDVDAGCFDIGE